MYVIIITYKVSLEEMSKYLAAHREYLNAHYELGHFLASGPQKPRTGGVILASVADRNLLDSILNEDPFMQHGIGDYKVIEFEPLMTCAEFAAYKIDPSI